MKILIVYTSKYGNTKEYIDILSQRIEADIIDLRSISKIDLEKYDKIVFGSGIYMGKINKLKKALKLLGDKNPIVFATGGSKKNEMYEKEVQNNNLSLEQQEQIKFFYLPGGIDITKVTGIMKFVFKLMTRILENKKNKTKDEEEFLNGIKYPSHLVNEEHTVELVQYLEAN